jgi:hypothetical protein
VAQDQRAAFVNQSILLVRVVILQILV